MRVIGQILSSRLLWILLHCETLQTPNNRDSDGKAPLPTKIIFRSSGRRSKKNLKSLKVQFHRWKVSAIDSYVFSSYVIPFMRNLQLIYQKIFEYREKATVFRLQHSK